MTPLTPEQHAAALRQVVADYQSYLAVLLSTEVPEDPKAFTARHAAARSALAHLEHLMKLHKDHPPGDAAAEAQALIAEVRRSMKEAGEESEEEGAEDDDG